MELRKGNICASIEEVDECIRYVVWLHGDEEHPFRFAPSDAINVRSVVQQLEEESK